MNEVTPRAFVFDAYGTLFDVHAAIARHREAAGPEADRFSEVWRTKQLEYSWTLTLSGRYVDFWTLTEQALDYAFGRFPSVDRALRPKLLDAYRELDAFPDARAAVETLKARGSKVAILTNGTPAMLEAAVKTSGMAGSFDALLSVDTVHAYKPRPEVYALVTVTFEINPQDVVFVSSNRWDVMGAQTFGFRPCWVNRAKVPDEYADAPPLRIIGDLSALTSIDFGKL
jgi:2-haloacid dehalogenase